MKHAKKMVLISADDHSNVKEELPRDILKDSLYSIDDKMKSILDNNSLTTEEKVNQYSNALDDYLLFVNKYKRREKEKYHFSKYDDGDETDDEEIELQKFSSIKQTLEKTLPKTLKKKGDIIIDFIEKSPNHTITNKGEIVVNGKIIENSNIVDLVHYQLRQRKKITNPPYAYPQFFQSLNEMNVPKEILKRKEKKISFTTKKSSKTPTTKITSSKSQPPKKRLKQNEWEPYT